MGQQLDCVPNTTLKKAAGEDMNLKFKVNWGQVTDDLECFS